MFNRSIHSVPSFSFSFSSSCAALAAALFSFALAGCAAEASHPAQPADVGDQHQAEVGDQHQADVGDEHPSEVGGGLPAPVTIDRSSDGKAVGVVAGQAVIVRLPSNGTTGYEWGVSSGATALGEPAISYEPAGDAPGAGGSTSFVWADTKSVPSGHYSIALAYQRSWEPGAIDTFTVEVDVLP
jgi:predicted secreted protein